MGNQRILLHDYLRKPGSGRSIRKPARWAGAGGREGRRRNRRKALSDGRCLFHLVGLRQTVPLSHLRHAAHVNRRGSLTPDRRPIWTPPRRRGQGCPGSEQEGPARSGATTTSPAQRSAGGACLPTGASRGGTAVLRRGF